ncbi:MAG: hypothetical protein AAFY88_08330 [Acidobacteriota bacterium]
MRAWFAAVLLLAATLSVAAPVGAQGPGPADADASSTAEPPAEPPSDADVDAATAEGSEPARVTVGLTPQETTVGGRVRAEVTVVWMGGEPAEPIRFPTWHETWGDAEILEISEVDAFVDQSGRHVATQVLELTVFETGDVRLPSRTFSVPLADRTVELSSEPTGFAVSSVLPDVDGEAEPGAAQGGAQDPASGAPGGPGAPDAAPELEPRASAGLAQLEANPAVFWAALAVLALLLGGGLEALRRQLARADAEGPADAEEQDAFAALEPLAELKARLEQLDPLHGGAAHTGISLALRRFLGRSLGFNAVESTTTEIQRHLLTSTPRRHLSPPAPLAQRGLEVLRACDLVKFAGLDADPSTVRGRISEVLDLGAELDQFVDQTRTPAPEDAAVEAREHAA